MASDQLSYELASLFRRDLTRLGQELDAVPDLDLLWRTLPGTTNSIGNLTLHLEGNLLEFIGRQLGGIDFTRDRPREFDSTGIALHELKERIQAIAGRIPAIVEGLTNEQLSAAYPEAVLGRTLTTRQFLIHLLGHLNYHLGQIDYLRRILASGSAISLAGL